MKNSSWSMSVARQRSRASHSSQTVTTIGHVAISNSDCRQSARVCASLSADI